MFSHVPLPRLLEGVAASLRLNVAPHVDDQFAAMQIRAIDELLRNLALCTEWRMADVTEELASVEALLLTLSAAGWCGSSPDQIESPPLASVAAALERRAVVLEQLRLAIAWALTQEADDPNMAHARMEIVAYMRAENTRERARLKSGMYA